MSVSDIDYQHLQFDYDELLRENSRLEKLNQEVKKVLKRVCNINCLYKDEGVPNLCANCIVGFGIKENIVMLQEMWKEESKQRKNHPTDSDLKLQTCGYCGKSYLKQVKYCSMCGKQLWTIDEDAQSSTNKIKINFESSKISSKTGLSIEEEEVMRSICEAWDKYQNLENQHHSDLEEFRRAISTLQRLLGMRVIRKSYSQGWDNLRGKTTL
jgi:uncharacterized Zn finger protein (UPF0148 family)